ncbi:MAG: sigma-70 family RNA polymerase sigma factor [Clostridia bacterium]|nr:sigma-70 family RNA polymerase sigma factor [Clostridia bacterium]
MTQLEGLLQDVLPALERFVKFKIHHRQDAEDIIQEVCLTAAGKFDTLKDPAAFKPWILRIAGNKCTDYYRARAKQMQISLDALSESALVAGRMGPTVQNVVRDTLDSLGDKDKQILYLWFFKGYTGEEIAKHLSLPLGTVKSRLHYAKEKFRLQYPYPPNLKGETNMSKLPKILPAYTITPTPLSPFPVRWEELQGWMLVPRLGESLSWGLYDAASRSRTEYTEMKVLGKAEIHGIEGVEISAIQYDAEDYYRTGSVDQMERRFVAQLTDTHCRYLAESHVENGVRKLYTFLDGDSFLENWGFGEDNCGNEVHLTPKGLLHRDGNTITGSTPKEIVDVVGRYTVTINGKSYDTICVMDIQCFNDGVASEQYLDQNGRTVLWRRFNKNDWAFSRYGKLWTEMLPENERLTINRVPYVHWYDCVSDYVL